MVHVVFAEVVLGQVCDVGLLDMGDVGGVEESNVHRGGDILLQCGCCVQFVEFCCIYDEVRSNFMCRAFSACKRAEPEANRTAESGSSTYELRHM